MKREITWLGAVLLLFTLLLLGRLTAQAQVGIGTTAPDASAALDVVSSGRGALLPRLTQATRLAMGTGGTPAPAPGLILYQTDGAQPGFWYNSGLAAAPKWLRLAGSDGVSFDPIGGLTVGLGGIGHVTVGSQTVANTSISPYFSTAGGDQRTQYVFRAAALLAAGLVAGPIRSVGFTVTTKNSTAPFLGFTLKMANTPATVASAPFPTTGVSTVYAANYTTVAGLNTHTFTGAFSWDGTSNLYLEACFDNAAAAGADAIAGTATSYSALTEFFNVPVGCTATAGSAFTSSFLPVVQFGQAAPYTLPAAQGQPGQVLTQQAGGAVSFANPQWQQSGNALTPNIATSNVGLGTASPVSRLSNTATNIIGSDGFGINSPSLTWTNSAVGYAGAFYNSDNTANGRNGLAVKVANGAASTTAFDVSQSPSQATAGTSLLRVRGDGNVGIGTSTPSSRLDVNGTVRVSGSNANEVNRTQTNSANLVPICYGNIAKNGSVNFAGSTNNFVVAHIAGSNDYTIHIIGENYVEGQYVTIATPSAFEGSFISILIYSASGDLIVAPEFERGFSFVVFKPLFTFLDFQILGRQHTPWVYAFGRAPLQLAHRPAGQWAQETGTARWAARWAMPPHSPTWL